MAEEADEEGLHEGDAERVGAEEDAAAEVVPGVEHGVNGADGQKGVEEDQAIDGSALDVDEDAADEEAEPADLDGDGFGGQLPAGGRGWRGPRVGSPMRDGAFRGTRGSLSYRSL